jgi:hypothetical protein
MVVPGTVVIGDARNRSSASASHTIAAFRIAAL